MKAAMTMLLLTMTACRSVPAYRVEVRSGSGCVCEAYPHYAICTKECDEASCLHCVEHERR